MDLKKATSGTITIKEKGNGFFELKVGSINLCSMEIQGIFQLKACADAIITQLVEESKSDEKKTNKTKTK